MDEFRIKPIVGSLSDLEHRLGIKRDELRELLKAQSELYHPYDTPKKKHPYPGKRRLEKLAAGPTKTRHIDNPVKQLKDLQRKILRRVLCDADLPEYMFGAVAGKTLVDHAKRHLQNQGSTLVRMDISSYYPSVTCIHVYFVWCVVLGCPPPIAQLLTQLTTFEFHLPQGDSDESCACEYLFGVHLCTDMPPGRAKGAYGQYLGGRSNILRYGGAHCHEYRTHDTCFTWVQGSARKAGNIRATRYKGGHRRAARAIYGARPTSKDVGASGSDSSLSDR